MTLCTDHLKNKIMEQKFILKNIEEEFYNNEQNPEEKYEFVCKIK